MKTLIVANWKQNMTAPQAKEWLEVLSSKFKVQSSKLEVVVCPSFVLIPVLHPSSIIHHLSIHLGAQDVSQFEEGPYTGEVSAKMLQDFVDYVIVGHSERRKHFGETDGDVAKKSVLVLNHGLVPIICVSSVEEARNWKLEAGVDDGSLRLESAVFVYEPVEHISTEGEFHPDDPEHANAIAQKIKDKVGEDLKVLYGGSVNAENVKSFVEKPEINGVLVGQASLDPEEFSAIVKTLKQENIETRKHYEIRRCK